MTEVVLAHESMRVLKRRVDVNRVRKWRHERDDLWIAFHNHYEASYYLDFQSLGCSNSSRQRLPYRVIPNAEGALVHLRTLFRRRPARCSRLARTGLRGGG